MGQHSEFTITLLMILPSMPHHHTPYEPPHFRNSLQYMTRPPPLVHPLRLSLIYIFMCPMLTECYMFFPDLWGRLKISMMEYVPLKHFFFKHTIFFEQDHWLVIFSIFYQCQVCRQGYLFWCISTSFFPHKSVAFLFCYSVSNYHIILSGRLYITNWYYNNSARYLCTIWGTLASDSKQF